MISLITGDDWSTWRGIRLRSLAESPDAFVPTLGAVDDREDVWRARIDSAIGCWIALVDGDAVGMVAADPMPDGRIQLASMFVAAEARERGIGASLIDGVVSAVQGRDLYLRVKADNAQAVSVYRRAGFVEADTDPDCDGCVTMIYDHEETSCPSTPPALT